MTLKPRPRYSLKPMSSMFRIATTAVSTPETAASTIRGLRGRLISTTAPMIASAGSRMNSVSFRLFIVVGICRQT